MTSAFEQPWSDGEGATKQHVRFQYRDFYLQAEW